MINLGLNFPRVRMFLWFNRLNRIAASAIWAVALVATVLKSALALSSGIIAGLLFDNGELIVKGCKNKYTVKCNFFKKWNKN